MVNTETKTARGQAQRYFREVVMAYDGDECLIWPYAKTGCGYGLVSVSGRLQLVSRLVCVEVNGPPPTPKHEAAHSCGNGSSGCCTGGHLSWKTHAANMADTIEHGTSVRGARHGMVKLTEAQAREILAHKGVAKQRDIAAKFGVSKANVSLIQSGKKWAWLNEVNR